MTSGEITNVSSRRRTQPSTSISAQRKFDKQQRRRTEGGRPEDDGAEREVLHADKERKSGRRRKRKQMEQIMKENGRRPEFHRCLELQQTFITRLWKTNWRAQKHKDDVGNYLDPVNPHSSSAEQRKEGVEERWTKRGRESRADDGGWMIGSSEEHPSWREAKQSQRVDDAGRKEDKAEEEAKAKMGTGEEGQTRLLFLQMDVNHRD